MSDASSNIKVSQWDKGNRTKNEKKHGITNKEAEEVFFNQPNIVNPDPTHSKKEQRFYIMGKTNQKKLLTIIFTIRDKAIRIISARPMSKKERRYYAKKTKTNS